MILVVAMTDVRSPVFQGTWQYRSLWQDEGIFLELR